MSTPLTDDATTAAATAALAAAGLTVLPEPSGTGLRVLPDPYDPAQVQVRPVADGLERVNCWTAP
jgi:hypothetical protein